MRTGIATPARRTTIRRHLRTVAAIAAVAAVGAVISGCEDNSPVAAPTSTLPAADPSAGASTPTVPEYTSDLDLTDDEKKAVDGALVASDGYVATLNRVFGSGGSDRTALDEFATGVALQTLTEDVDDLAKNDEVMAGKFELQTRSINELRKSATEVSILSCVDNSKFKRVKSSASFAPSGSEPLTVEFTAVQSDGSWKVSAQDLWSEECAG